MVKTKTLMKLFCIVITWVLAIQISYADDRLHCSQDLPAIKKLYAEQKDIFDHGTFKDLQNYLDKYDYTAIFQESHPNQTFHLYEWVPSDQATAELQSSFEDKMEIAYAVKQPFANFILNDHELCLMTVDMSFTSDEVTTSFENLTNIWIRKTNSDHWYFFEYHEWISPEDFNTFFPNFPENIIFPITETDITTLEH